MDRIWHKPIKFVYKFSWCETACPLRDINPNSNNVSLSKDFVLPIGLRHSVWPEIAPNERAKMCVCCVFEIQTHSVSLGTISHWSLLERWCSGTDCGSANRRHIHLTELIYPLISIWSIILAIVNQALKPLRYSLGLESLYTRASTPFRDTVHDPDLRAGFSNRQITS